MRSSLASALLVIGFAATSLVLADGKKPVRSRPRPRPAAAVVAKEGRAEGADERTKSSSDAQGATSSETQPRAPAAEPSSGDLARAPAGARTEVAGGGVRSSPLNPRPEELSDAGPAPLPEDVDRILGDIATLRARVAAIGDTLFKSRIVVRLETKGDHAKIGKLAVSLDDGVVYTAPPGLSFEDETMVYDHAVAAGRHILAVEVERRDDRGESFGTGQKSRFALEVPENQRLQATVRIEDDSDMASDFPSSQKGSYDLRVRVRARAER